MRSVSGLMSVRVGASCSSMLVPPLVITSENAGKFPALSSLFHCPHCACKTLLMSHLPVLSRLLYEPNARGIQRTEKYVRHGLHPQLQPVERNPAHWAEDRFLAALDRLLPQDQRQVADRAHAGFGAVRYGDRPRGARPQAIAMPAGEWGERSVHIIRLSLEATRRADSSRCTRADASTPRRLWTRRRSTHLYHQKEKKP